LDWFDHFRLLTVKVVAKDVSDIKDTGDVSNMLTYGRDYTNSQATCALFYEDIEEGSVSQKINGEKNSYRIYIKV